MIRHDYRANPDPTCGGVYTFPLRTRAHLVQSTPTKPYNLRNIQYRKPHTVHVYFMLSRCTSNAYMLLTCNLNVTWVYTLHNALLWVFRFDTLHVACYPWKRWRNLLSTYHMWITTGYLGCCALPPFPWSNMYVTYNATTNRWVNCCYIYIYDIVG